MDTNANKTDCLDLEQCLLSDNSEKRIAATVEAVKIYRKDFSSGKSTPHSVGRRKIFFFLGLLCLIIACAVYIIDPLSIILDYNFNMKEGNFMAKTWAKPPISFYKGLTIFNVTNSERFLAGLDKKLHVEEVGPYVYEDQLENTNVTWYNNGTLSFIQNDNLKYSKELSVGDPEKDIIIIPNLVLLAIANVAYHQSITVNLALSSLVSYLNSQPFTKVRVKDFLWGYEDPLLSLGANIFKNWLTFDKIGIFDRMMDIGTNVQTISSNVEDTFMIKLYNGSPILPNLDVEPEESDRCSQANGTFEGLTYPRHSQPEKLYIYRKMFCRSVGFNLTGYKEDKRGFRVSDYKMDDYTFSKDNPDTKCFCKPGKECMPDGVTDIAPCYYGFPFGLSKPHFKDVDPSAFDKVDGMNYDSSLHGSSIQIQTDMGVPMDVQVSVQINLVTKRARYIPRIRAFNDMIIPVAWIKVFFNGLPEDILFLMWLALKFGPWAQWISIWTLISTGCLLLAFSLVGTVSLISNKTSINMPNVIHSKK